MPMSRIDGLADDGHQGGVGLADRAVEGGQRRHGDVVADDVGIAGRVHRERAGLDRRRRGVDDERVVEVAARVAVARGKRQLRPGRRVADRVLAVERHALQVGDHRRAAAEQGDLVGVGSQRQTGGRQVDDQRVGRADRKRSCRRG